MISYPLQTPDGTISKLRVKRLLLLALEPRHHKQFFQQYYYLINLGLIDWSLGTAFLTTAGQRELMELLLDDVTR